MLEFIGNWHLLQHNYNLCSVFSCCVEILITLRTKGFLILGVFQFSISLNLISESVIDIWICQSGATIVVQLLSSASKAPTAYFPLIKTLNNSYNFVQFLSAVRKYWSYWVQKVSQYQGFFKALKVAAVVLL